MFTYLLMHFMYRNGFGANEHGGLGRIIYQLKNVFRVQITDIQDPQCLKMKSRNYSATASPVIMVTRDKIFLSVHQLCVGCLCTHCLSGVPINNNCSSLQTGRI
jgi:hypothetical protein